MGAANGRKTSCKRVTRKPKVRAQVEAPAGPPLRPGQCRAYMRRKLAAEFRGIVEGFVKGAKAGSCQHVKLATELLEPRPRKAKAVSGRRTLERWLDEIEKDS